MLRGPHHVHILPGLSVAQGLAAVPSNGQSVLALAALPWEVSGGPVGATHEACSRRGAGRSQVLEMLERGETPPGIRHDIIDTPPDPQQAASEARLKPRSKPWERSQQGRSGAPPPRSFYIALHSMHSPCEQA